MKINNLKRTLAFISIVCLTVPAGCSPSNSNTRQKQDAMIQDIASWEMGFLAVDDLGNILNVQSDGTSSCIVSGVDEKLSDIWAGDDEIWIAGEKGVVLHGDGGLTFTKEDTGKASDLQTVTGFQEHIICGGADGTVISRDNKGDWQSCKIDIQGNVTGMDASGDLCLLVTDQGEIATSTDGSTWEAFSYNEYYMKEAEFEGLIYNGSNFWAYGRTEEGTRLFFTDSGTAWGERDINYLEGEDADLSKYQILSIASDGQQLYAWCDENVMLTFPDCIQCNKKTEVEQIKGGAIGYNGGNLLIAQNDASFEIISTESAKQYNISGETAYEKQQQDAVIIDVRSKEEYEEKHIKDSVWIELKEIPKKLPQLYPDQGQELIFYCAKGIRSQSAVEEALQLGYVEIYSLGSINNWEYDFEE